MRIKTGIDIVEVRRMRAAIDRWGDNFLKKIFTGQEIAYSKNKRFSCQHFAARYAAKEACVKAFGSVQNLPMRWIDIEVLNDKDGMPAVKFHNSAKKLKKILKVNDISITLSHSRKYAIASAVLLGDE